MEQEQTEVAQTQESEFPLLGQAQGQLFWLTVVFYLQFSFSTQLKQNKS